jgi:hypothetical protein
VGVDHVADERGEWTVDDDDARSEGQTVHQLTARPDHGELVRDAGIGGQERLMGGLGRLEITSVETLVLQPDLRARVEGGARAGQR